MAPSVTRGILSDSAASLRCEVAVIGSGPGGAITACLLAEAGRDVLLIEEGAYLPIGSCVPFTMDEMILKYRNGGLTAALGPVKVQYVEGRCVGGGSEINSGLYHRTPPDILEKWRTEFQVKALGARDLLPHFEACERDLQVSYIPGGAPRASLKLHEGAQRLDWQSFEVPRWFSYEERMNGGSAPRGRRQSMSETYIPRALQAGCRLLPHVAVRRLRRKPLRGASGAAGSGWILHGDRVGAGQEQRSVEIHAATVFVCAGAVQTPALLRRSGITRNIGNSLRLHPMIKVIGQFLEPVNSIDMGVPVHQVKEFAPRFSFGGSISTPPYLALGMKDYAPHARRLMEDWPYMAVYYAATLSHGEGSVRCLPGYRDPLVRYRITADDLSELSSALRRLSELLFEAGAVALYPSVAGGSRLASRADLDRLPALVTRERTNLMTVHLFSSCPMGEDRRRCAADSFGRVHGHEGLYISDASLLCTPPGVNPQGSIMALARRNAIGFLDR